MDERNVLGGPLEPCGSDPVTGFFRDTTCRCVGDDGEGNLGIDPGLHAVCVYVTDDFLRHQRSLGNDLITPVPHFGFSGLHPGDRWCVVAERWLQSFLAGHAAPVVLAATSEHALRVVPMSALLDCAADVPSDASDLDHP